MAASKRWHHHVVVICGLIVSILALGSGSPVQAGMVDPSCGGGCVTDCNPSLCDRYDDEDTNCVTEAIDCDGWWEEDRCDWDFDDNDDFIYCQGYPIMN